MSPNIDQSRSFGHSAYDMGSHGSPLYTRGLILHCHAPCTVYTTTSGKAGVCCTPNNYTRFKATESGTRTPNVADTSGAELGAMLGHF